MKKGFFVLFLILILLTAFCISVSGCLSSLYNDTKKIEPVEDVDEILKQYELNIFMPVIQGNEKAVESGTYYASASEIQVIRVVNASDEITLLKENALLALKDAEYESIYFLTAEDFSMTADGINAIAENPIPVNLNYTLNVSNKAAKLVLEENFSGVLVYTFRPDMNSTSFIINDGAKAVQIILPEKTTTGNRLIGRAAPTQDMTETDEFGRTVLKWNAPTGTVSVKFYNESAPGYLLFAAIILVAASGIVFLWYRYQIGKLHKITKMIDSDDASGFRKSK